jgi:hypothetical protein
VPDATTADYGCFLHTPKFGWVMELRVNDRWETVDAPPGRPYRYETERQAAEMLERCYPDVPKNKKRVRQEKPL